MARKLPCVRDPVSLDPKSANREMAPVAWLSHLFFFSYFLKFVFNWRIIASQCCVGFYHTTASWTASVPSLLDLPPAPLGCHRAGGWVPWVIPQPPISSFAYGNVCFIAAVSVPTLPLPHDVCKPFLFLCLHSCPANRFISPIFLDSTYIHYYTIFGFLFLTSLCITGSQPISSSFNFLPPLFAQYPDGGLFTSGRLEWFSDPARKDMLDPHHQKIEVGGREWAAAVAGGGAPLGPCR